MSKSKKKLEKVSFNAPKSISTYLEGNVISSLDKSLIKFKRICERKSDSININSNSTNYNNSLTLSPFVKKSVIKDDLSVTLNQLITETSQLNLNEKKKGICFNNQLNNESIRRLSKLTKNSTKGIENKINVNLSR